MTKVKICGITNIDDAIEAAKLGAWAIGFIFYPKSPRYVAPETVCEISSKVKPLGVKTIGVFVNESQTKINEIAKIAQLDMVQMHGTEHATECDKLEIPFIKNIRALEEIAKYPNAYAFLVDANDTQNWGGTGKLGDWSLAQDIKTQGKILMLSGGISTDNIEKAIQEVNPDIIDISSSIEISPGKKAPAAMQKFFEKLKEIN